jgi:hypothetical protein
MADNRRKFLGPNAGTIRDPTSNSLEHGRMRNPPRWMEMSTFMPGKPSFHANDKKLASVASSVTGR